MWRISSALVITWIDVLRIDNVLIRLWDSRNSSGEFVKVWGNLSSNFVAKWVVKELKWNEEFLPAESPSNLNNHSKESISKFFGIFVRNCYVGNCIMELWKIMITNESSRVSWDQNATKFGNNPMCCPPWEDEGESSSNHGSKGNEVNMRKISFIEKLCPLWW